MPGTIANVTKPLKRLSATIADKVLAAAVRSLEDKVDELDLRVRDAERRLTAGSL